MQRTIQLSALGLAIMLSSCGAYHLSVADKAYDRLAYGTATTHYEKALVRIEDRDALVRAAHAYREQEQLNEADMFFAKANGMSALDLDDALAWSRVLVGLGKHDKAEFVLAGIAGAAASAGKLEEVAAIGTDPSKFFQDTTLFVVYPIDLPGMTAAFSAVPTAKGFIFVGEKPAGVNKQNPWNGASFLDLYETQRQGAYWSDPKAVTGDVNGRFHEGPAVLSADGNTMYFTRSDYYKYRLQKADDDVSNLKLFRAVKNAEGQWTDIGQFIHNRDDHSTGHPALSPDGKTMYFISDAPGGAGGTDLYSCTHDGTSWGDPINLGGALNTIEDEMFPVMRGDTLFFSSKGHAGLGGLDIFMSVRSASGWSVPENMGYPVNTTRDDLAFVPIGGGSGYLTSNRGGQDRIYTWQQNDPTFALEGQFTDDELGLPMLDVEVRLMDLNDDEELSVVTSSDGKYHFDLKPAHAYRVSGSKDGMFTESRGISTVGERHSKVFREDMRLKQVQIDKPILVENIYYDYDKWDLRPEACVELDKLVHLFNDNPKLSFELSSHTDPRSSDVYNLVLSEARAKSAVDYLIRKGVDPMRITAKGYGESRPVNHCRDGVECTEEEYQLNRRTEFKVTKIDGPTAQGL